MEAIIDSLLAQFESGRISRRDMVKAVAGLAAFGGGVTSGGTAAAANGGPTFTATSLNHIALRVTDVARSRDFYQKHLGLTVTRDSSSSCFLTFRDHFLALFQGNTPGLDHYCFSVENYDPDAVVETLGNAGLEPSRHSDRVYFPDPDGTTVQLAATNHQA